MHRPRNYDTEPGPWEPGVLGWGGGSGGAAENHEFDDHKKRSKIVPKRTRRGFFARIWSHEKNPTGGCAAPPPPPPPSATSYAYDCVHTPMEPGFVLLSPTKYDYFRGWRIKLYMYPEMLLLEKRVLLLSHRWNL